MKRKTSLLIMALSITVFVMGQFKLEPLAYKYNALEPYVDSTTMYIHFNLHHQTYATNLNKSLEKYPELYKKDIVELLKNIQELPADIQLSVKNNGGGYYNHNLFWKMMAPAGTTKMSEKLEKKLIENFGSIDKFKTDFENAGMTRFGSGWAWLIIEPSGKLKICSTANQDSPIYADAPIKGKPLLTLDVWEHAYYLKYQNKRAAYVKAFWSVVNWAEVEKLLDK